MNQFDKYFKQNNPELYQKEDISYFKQVGLWLGLYIKLFIFLGVIGIAGTELFLFISKRIGNNIELKLTKEEQTLKYIKD